MLKQIPQVCGYPNVHFGKPEEAPILYTSEQLRPSYGMWFAQFPVVSAGRAHLFVIIPVLVEPLVTGPVFSKCIVRQHGFNEGYPLLMPSLLGLLLLPLYLTVLAVVGMCPTAMHLCDLTVLVRDVVASYPRLIAWANGLTSSRLYHLRHCSILVMPSLSHTSCSCLQHI